MGVPFTVFCCAAVGVARLSPRAKPSIPGVEQTQRYVRFAFPGALIKAAVFMSSRPRCPPPCRPTARP